MARIKWNFQDDNCYLDMDNKIQLVNLIVDLEIKDLSGDSIGDNEFTLNERSIFELWLDEDESDQSVRVGAGLLFSSKLNK